MSDIARMRVCNKVDIPGCKYIYRIVDVDGFFCEVTVVDPDTDTNVLDKPEIVAKTDSPGPAERAYQLMKLMGDSL